MLPSLSRPRRYPGICLHQNCIYAFGGEIGKRCDKLAVKDRVWCAQPDCLQKRWAFNPVIYQDLIYLPNGCNESIETFNPQTQTFRLLHYGTNLHNSSANFIHKDKLILLGMRGYYELNLRNRVGKRKNYKEDQETAWSVHSPVLYGQEVALVWTYGQLWKLTFVNIHTFAVRYIAIPNTE